MELSSPLPANTEVTGDFTGITNPHSFDQFDFEFKCRIIDN